MSKKVVALAVIPIFFPSVYVASWFIAVQNRNALWVGREGIDVFDDFMYVVMLYICVALTARSFLLIMVKMRATADIQMTIWS